ncbi:MAG: CSLREA domain-containing protein [Acidimicrobiia bacterium]|nr:CSLREA domain-containing protein [Acidimicrobiia bacterium]MBA3955117.1 CSLREA domain-containing protein [Acidimicrobiia bacterium]
MRSRTIKIAVALGLGAPLAVVGPALAQNSPIIVTTSDDTVDASPGDGQCADASGECSLRAAIQEANAGRGAAIHLADGATYVLQIAGADEDEAATGDLDVTSSVRIQGNGATVDANGLDRAFDVAAGASLAVEELDVLGGVTPSGQSGGAFQSAGSLHITDSRLGRNVAEGPMSSGGAVFNAGGELVVEDSVFQQNSATRAGGAIEANAGSTTLTSVRLVDNDTGPGPGNGGGFHLTGAGTVDVIRSEATGNTATAEGGGLWNSATGAMTVVDSELRGNVAGGNDADQGGGGLFNDGGELTVRGSEIDANVADGTSGSGGGILNNLGTLNVGNSTLSNNTAVRAGGGVEANVGTTKLKSVHLDSNETGPTPGNGGGFHLTGAGTVTVSHSRVTDNIASAEGGGLWNSATGTMTVAKTQFTGNVASGAAADQGGGGLFNDGGELSVTRSVFTDNSADGTSGSGGGILNNQGTLSVAGALFADNSATRAGGGIEANVGTTTLVNIRLENNTTGPNPGNGGGLHLTGAGTVDITRARVIDNVASAEGGGLWSSSTGTMIVTRSVVMGNVAPVGPDVFNDGGTFTLNGSPVAPTP